MEGEVILMNADRAIATVGSSKRDFVKVDGELIAVGDTSSWKGLVATFVASQRVRESSRELYTKTLTQYFKWVNSLSLDLSTLTNFDILKYEDYLESKGLASLTRGSYLVAVRKFYEWTESHKIYPNIAKGTKTPSKKQLFKKQHLTDEKSGELLSYFAGRSLRDYAIVNLILRTGLRTIEVQRALVGDITFENGRRVLKVWGKGRDKEDKKEDLVVLSDKAYKPIEDYLATRRRPKDEEPLFPSMSNCKKGTPIKDRVLTTRFISGLCKKGLKAIGLSGKEFTAHSLRHTTAVAILKHGGALEDVQSVLRHASPVTSQIYVESIKKERRLERAPELALDSAF